MGLISQGEMQVLRIPADSEDALRLVGAMVGALHDVDGPQVGDDVWQTVPQFSPPGGGYVAIYDGVRAVAGGAVRRLEDRVGEVKRMYVVEDMRSRGLARRLLDALEGLARDLGYERVRLDTGPNQPHARALYLSAGYVEIEDYNQASYASFWGEKRL